jgi:gliding motility-associated-like protein
MNITGTNPILNAGNGINLSNSSYNTIGGTLAADGNVVSGNTGIGINLLANSSNNTLQNNFVGTNKAGTSKFANSVGISLTSSNTNTILSNLVSGNTGDGIVLSLSGSTAGNGNIINDNTIGFTNGGSVALANGGIGISLTQSSFNTIGTTGLPNVIGNHVGAGISLGTTSNSNTIAFNVVGLDKAKTTKAANDNGIVVTASNSNNINNNVISGNTNDGLVLDNASSNIVSTNIIGTNAAGSATDLGNGASNNGIGINLKNGAASNQIGLSNNVAYNQQSIVVDGLATTKNKISQNSIYCNLSNDIVPGINLKNSGNISFLTPFIVTQKPGLDTLGKQLVMGGITLALGSTVEVFQKDAGCTNCSQGKTYIGSTTVVATSPYLGDPDQGFVYNFAPATVLKKANCNDYIVTITDPAGNTSQFSTCSECVTTCTPSTVTDVVSKTECESALLKSFTATSTTNAADTYTWQKWNGVAYVDIVPSTIYAVTKSVAGAITTSTLTIDQITAAMNGDKFRLKVNTCGSDIFSNPVTEAVLTVNTLPVVTLDPIDANVCVGVNNTFTSTATGTGVTYKWQVDPNTGNFADITPAETAANLTLSNIQFSSNKYKYRVQVSGTCPPSTALYSLVANLKVDTVTAITIQPSNSTVCTGNDAGFKVKVIGRLDKTTDLPNLTYQWQVDPNTGTFVNTTDGAVYAGSTTDSLTVTTSAGMDLYKYRLVATGDCNPETSTIANIIFTTSPVLTTSPTSLPFCEGTNTTLTGAIANASSYKWEVTSDSLNWTTVVADANYSNVTTATLTITNTPLSFNRHRYRLVGKGACAPDVTTLEVILNVNEKPSIVTTPVLQTVCEGTNANFNVVAKGAGLSYQWQESVNNGAFANITNGGKYGITSATATTSSLAITPADSAMNNNKYQVIVSGTCTPAITSVPVLLTVNTTPKISNPANVTMCENETKTVSVSAKGTGVSVKWQYNNAGTYVDLVSNPLLPFSTFNTNTLTITNPAIALTNTTYRAVASGTCPSPVNSTDFTLVVNEIPRVTVQPLPQTVCEGDNATYSVTATGTSTTYQWQVNNGSGWVPIGDGTFYSGTTTNTLTVNSALLAYNNYDYRAVVSGTCTPAVNSNPAKLNVNELPKITNQPATVTVCENGSKNFTVAAQGTGLVFNWELSTDGGATWSTLPVGAPYSAVTTVISANSSSSMLSISPITLLMATYKYRAVVTGTCATLTPVVSSEVGFILTTAPTITQHPADLSICVDANASFQALATPADGSLTFQWQIKKSGGAFVNVPNDPALYSINNESFAILAADASFANAQVQVIVTGACLPVLTSIPATISFVIPSVVVTPLDTICSGTTTKLGVTFPLGSNFSASWTVNKPTGVTGLSSMNFTSVNDSIKDKFDNTTNNDAYVTYTFLPRSAAGCLGTPVEAKVLVYPQTIPTLKGLNDICPGTIFTLTTQLFNHGKYTWYKDSDPVALVGDTTNVFTDTMSTLQEDYTVVFTDVCGNAYSADTSVVPIFGVEVYFDVPTKVCSDFPATFTSHVVSTNKDIDIYKWNFGAGAAATVVDSSITDVIYTYDDAGVYNVKLEAYFKGCLVGDSITPVTIQDCSIIAPNLFTPNGDGANDGWYIENIEYYPNASVTIFNRWGVIVWTAVNGYVNRWDGNNSEKQELEEGTYYYVIDLKSGDKKKAIKKGYITILRDIHSK